MATTNKQLDYAAAYDVLPFPVAVIENGEELYRNEKAGDLPIEGGDVLNDGSFVLQHDGKWYTRHTKALASGAILVSWQYVDDKLRLRFVHDILTAPPGKALDDAKASLSCGGKGA